MGDARVVKFGCGAELASGRPMTSRGRSSAAVKIVVVACGAVIVLVFGPIALFATVIATATGAQLGPAPTTTATTDIPPDLWPVYRDAASSCPLSWEVLAAIGKVEGDHGRSDAPGVQSGSNAAGAMGPMQFLASTWSAYGVDGDHDGRADVYDSIDSIWGAARYLCANGAGNADTLRSAIWAYNHSDSYVAEVLRIAASYANEPSTQTGHALPVDRAVFEQHRDYLTAPHHDYPAIDIPVAVGTTVYAVAGGTVALSSPNVGICGGAIVIDATDGARYTYCHLSNELVASGDRVDTSAPIALSGGQPDAPGAGDATGPHLHLGIAVNGTNVCPQALLTAWFNGKPMDPNSAAMSGCSY
jgi:hypothetical protein